MDDFLSKIRSFAEADENIRLVLLNGSRANPNHAADAYSDYDIIYGVGSFEKYARLPDWAGYFGTVLIHQDNELEKGGVRYPIYLLQFDSGARLDVSFFPMEAIAAVFDDSLTVALLDKDGAAPPNIEASEASYITREPSAEEYAAAVNEFWWCAINVAKGIARRELCYAKYMYESIVRECFIKIVSWHVGMKNGWKVNVGKYGRHIERYVSPELWGRIQKTYSGPGYAEFWGALTLCCEIAEGLCGEIARGVEGLGRVPAENGKGILAYIRGIEQGGAAPLA
jgi:aminoglycoside 6-adenylyltransferase